MLIAGTGDLARPALVTFVLTHLPLCDPQEPCYIVLSLGEMPKVMQEHGLC
jgi:hypothetical protein